MTRTLGLMALLFGVGLGAGSCGPSELDKIALTEGHRQKVLEEIARAEQDVVSARRLLEEGNPTEALSLLARRIERLDVLLYDEVALRSRAHVLGDLDLARGYDALIADLETLSQTLVVSLDAPLQRVLTTQIRHDRQPDARARQEALDVLLGAANEVFSTFKAGYRTEIVENLKVRLRDEPDVDLREKMKEILKVLDRG